MYGEGGANWPVVSSTLQRHPMKAQVKNAVITTAIVLATIFALRQVGVTRGFVDRALNG